MTKNQFEVRMAVIRERLRQARMLVTEAVADVPWVPEHIQCEGREAQTALSALDLSMEQHEPPPTER